jgi:hypothetical protein
MIAPSNIIVVYEVRPRWILILDPPLALPVPVKKKDKVAVVEVFIGRDELRKILTFVNQFGGTSFIGRPPKID